MRSRVVNNHGPPLKHFDSALGCNCEARVIICYSAMRGDKRLTEDLVADIVRSNKITQKLLIFASAVSSLSQINILSHVGGCRPLTAVSQ